MSVGSANTTINHGGLNFIVFIIWIILSGDWLHFKPENFENKIHFTFYALRKPLTIHMHSPNTVVLNQGRFYLSGTLGMSIDLFDYDN